MTKKDVQSVRRFKAWFPYSWNSRRLCPRPVADLDGDSFWTYRNTLLGGGWRRHRWCRRQVSGKLNLVQLCRLSPTYFFNSCRCLGLYPLCLRSVGDHFSRMETRHKTGRRPVRDHFKILVWDRSAISQGSFFSYEFTRLEIGRRRAGDHFNILVLDMPAISRGSFSYMETRLNSLSQEAGIKSVYRKDIHAHRQRQLLRCLSQERSIAAGNQLSYSEYIAVHLYPCQTCFAH